MNYIQLTSDYVTGARDYAVPDVTKSALNAALLPIYPPVSTLRGHVLNQLDIPPPYDPLYAASDVVSAQGLNIPNLQVSRWCYIHSHINNNNNNNNFIFRRLLLSFTNCYT